MLKLAGSKRVRENEPVFESAIDMPPAFLKGRALQAWKETLPSMVAAGLGSAIEAEALACYCQAIADRDQAQELLDEQGIIAVTERGMTKHPATTIKNQAMILIKQFASEFGFTPASRGRVTVAKKAESNEFADF